MAILSRIIKIFKADIHGVMDHLEDRGLLLKQHLRDMEEALRRKQARLTRLTALRNQAREDLAKYHRQMEALENDLMVAVRKEKDDIARMIIRKIKPLENMVEYLGCQLKTMDEDVTQLHSQLQQQRQRFEQLQYRASEYRHKIQMQQWEKDTIDPVSHDCFGGPTDQEIELELIKRKEASAESRST
jgi:phage shock protein A